MSEAPLPRSWLYVPASRPELFPKALAGPAEAVILDLEDAVPPHAKVAARNALAALLDLPRGKPVWVRANHPATPWGESDVAALAELPVDGVRLPKSENPELVAEVAGRLRRPVHLLLESALGVENALALARSSTWVTGIALGEADLLADLAATEASALGYARGRVVSAARAAGLASPVMSVYTALDDLDGLRADTRAARAVGFFGRAVVHPRQVPIVNDAFTPTASEVRAARRIVATMRSAEDAGLGAQVDESGRFVDPAVAHQARLVLALAERDDLRTPPTADHPEDPS